MIIVEIARATVAFTTPLSVVAFAAALFAYVALRQHRGSIRSSIIGDAPLSWRGVTNVLKMFKNDEQRLGALEQILQNDSATARRVLDRAKRFDVSLATAESRLQYVVVLGILGVVLLLFAVLGTVIGERDDALAHAQTKDQVNTFNPEPAPGLSPRQTSPAPGMARIKGGRVELGRFDVAGRPSACANLGPDEDCTFDTHPERHRIVETVDFDLDILEVDRGAFAQFLSDHHDLWRRSSRERDVLVASDELLQPLASFGGNCPPLRVEAAGHVRVPPGGSRRPMTCVSWYAADLYCRVNGKRLPSDVEWELAAKGAEGRSFPWGRERPQRDTVAFDLVRSERGPREVGTSRGDETPESVRDLGGNVAEWVDDGSPLESQLVRGGSWTSANECHLLTSGCAALARAEHGAVDVGFRCARTITGGQR